MPYFSSGVLSIDLDRWRDEEVGNKCFRFIGKFYKTIRFPDQDALNAILYNRWKGYNQVYNVSSFWDKPKYPVDHLDTSVLPKILKCFISRGQKNLGIVATCTKEENLTIIKF